MTLLLAVTLACSGEHGDSAYDCPSMCDYVAYQQVPAVATQAVVTWAGLTHDINGDTVTDLAPSSLEVFAAAHPMSFRGCEDSLQLSSVGSWADYDVAGLDETVIELEPQATHWLLILGGLLMYAGAERSSMIGTADVTMAVPDDYPSACLR